MSEWMNDDFSLDAKVESLVLVFVWLDRDQSQTANGEAIRMER